MKRNILRTIEQENQRRERFGEEMGKSLEEIMERVGGKGRVGTMEGIGVELN